MHELPQIERVGAAMTLTPYSDVVLAEASRFAQRLETPLTLIHTGASEAESREYLEATAARLSVPHERHVIWNQKDPCQALLAAASENGIELLVVGAFEGPLVKRRRFLSPVARCLAESAGCSLLLVVHPRTEKQEFRRIVAITDFSECSKVACRQALWLAEKDSAEWVCIVSIHTVFMDARAGIGASDGKLARTRGEEEELMESFVADLSPARVSLDWRVIDATTGLAACDFAEEMEADLLVLPGHNRPGGRVPAMADWALQVVPCSLWIVHCGPCWNPQNFSSQAQGRAQTALASTPTSKGA